MSTARIFQLIRLEIRAQVLGWSGAWWFIIAIVLAQGVTPLLGLFVWLRVPGSGNIGPYYLAVVCVSLLTASFENHTFAQSIYSGGLVSTLLAPRPPVVIVIGENLAIRFWMAVFGLPLTALIAWGVGIRYEPVAVISALPAVVLAAMLHFLFVWTLAMTAFWTERVHAVVGFGETLIFLLGGSAAPVQLLPQPWRDLAHALPFHTMLGFPAEIASGELSPGAILSGYSIGFGWTAVLLMGAVWAWRAGVRRYSSVGA